MDEQALPGDFREFLKLLNEAEVEYLLSALTRRRGSPDHISGARS